MRPLLRRAAAAAKPPTAAQRRCFRYHLPQSSIAKYPASPRGSSRLLVAADGELTDSRFEALTSHLPRDALVIVNDSRVVRARLRCAGPDGAFEVLLLALADADATSPPPRRRGPGLARHAAAERRRAGPDLRRRRRHAPARRGRPLAVARGGRGRRRRGRRRRAAAARGLASLLDAHGTTPVPPYLDRPDDDGDDDAYQTAYAPTREPPRRRASTSRTATSAVAAAFETHAVTLHVGAGTFRPVVGRVEDHAMHAERCGVQRAARAAPQRAAARRRRGHDVRARPREPRLARAGVHGASRAGADLGHLDQWSGGTRDALAADAATSLLEATDATTFSASTSLCITPDGRRRRRPRRPPSPASAGRARKKRVLLHSCCAPCSGAMIEEMVETLDADVTVFFYNPNIHPRSEYELRKRENERYAAKLGIAFVDGDYDPDEWYRRAGPRPPAQARSSVALRAAGTQDDDAFLAEGVRTPLRVFGIGALWLGLIGYIAIGAPGKSEAAQALDSELLAKLVANPFDPSCPALFTVLFNWMGVWPAVYAALLLPGADDQKPVPAVPFLAASVAFGMFAISPYLALREYRGATNRAPASLGGKWFESKLNAAVLGAGAVGLAAWGATAGDFGANVAEFKQLFDTQLFVHATTCDFCCLSLLAVGLGGATPSAAGATALRPSRSCRSSARSRGSSSAPPQRGVSRVR
ncbi:queuosine biosynthesis protein [Aureococcus anophagefferens]|nr:queuosine biosynthesis protein [Aureococcus anophagefferens]